MEISGVLSPSQLVLAPFPRDGKVRHTRLEGCEKRLRVITVITRPGKVRQNNSRARWHTCRTLYVQVIRTRRTENEREGKEGRLYRRDNTFVSQGDTLRQRSVRYERAASTDRALRREHMAALAARVDSHRLPSLPSAGHRGLPQTSLVRINAKCNYRQISKLQSDLKLVIKNVKVKMFQIYTISNEDTRFLLVSCSSLVCYFTD